LHRQQVMEKKNIWLRHGGKSKKKELGEIDQQKQNQTFNMEKDHCPGGGVNESEGDKMDKRRRWGVEKDEKAKLLNKKWGGCQ